MKRILHAMTLASYRRHGATERNVDLAPMMDETSVLPGIVRCAMCLLTS